MPFRSPFCTESTTTSPKKANPNKADKENSKEDKTKHDTAKRKEDTPKSKEDLLKEEVESLKEKLKTKDKDLSKSRNDVLRTLADMENLRARSQRDNEAARNYAIQSFAKSLLDVSDNLQLAVTNAKADMNAITKDKPNKPLEVLYEGIALTEKTLAKAFKKHHITQFNSLDTKFDPNKHDGLFQFSDPTRTPGTVGNVLKEGYMIRDRVLRPAQVGTIMAPQTKKQPDTPKENTNEETPMKPQAPVHDRCKNEQANSGE